MTVGGWLAGDPEQYDRDHALDLSHVIEFLSATQPHLVENKKTMHCVFDQGLALPVLTFTHRTGA